MRLAEASQGVGIRLRRGGAQETDGAGDRMGVNCFASVKQANGDDSFGHWFVSFEGVMKLALRPKCNHGEFGVIRGYTRGASKQPEGFP